MCIRDSFSSINEIRAICKEVGLFTYLFTLYIHALFYILLHFLCILIIWIHVNLIISDVHKELSSFRMKNSNRKYKLRTGLFIAWINYWGHILIRYSIYKLLRGLFVLNFVIGGKVTSLPKVIKYVKRSKYSFPDFSAKHTPSATLTFFQHSSNIEGSNSCNR